MLEPAEITWGQGFLSIVDTQIQSAGPASKVSEACQATGAVTVEAWVRTTVDGSGPVQTIHVAAPGERFTDVEVIDDVTIWITESTEGQLIERVRRPP